MHHGKTQLMPCKQHNKKTSAGVSKHRPKSAANGKRFGEADNPGPSYGQCFVSPCTATKHYHPVRRPPLTGARRRLEERKDKAAESPKKKEFAECPDDDCTQASHYHQYGRNNSITPDIDWETPVTIEDQVPLLRKAAVTIKGAQSAHVNAKYEDEVLTPIAEHASFVDEKHEHNNITPVAERDPTTNQEPLLATPVMQMTSSAQMNTAAVAIKQPKTKSGTQPAALFIGPIQSQIHGPIETQVLTTDQLAALVVRKDTLYAERFDSTFDSIFAGPIQRIKEAFSHAEHDMHAYGSNARLTKLTTMRRRVGRLNVFFKRRKNKAVITEKGKYNAIREVVIYRNLYWHVYATTFQNRALNLGQVSQTLWDTMRNVARTDPNFNLLLQHTVTVDGIEWKGSDIVEATICCAAQTRATMAIQSGFSLITTGVSKNYRSGAPSGATHS